MKRFVVMSCLALAVMARPEAGYSYHAPAPAHAPELSVALLPPPSSSHVAVAAAPSFSHGVVSSHGSLGLGAHSSGGSVSLGSSYSVAPSASLGSSYSVAPSTSFSSFNSGPSVASFAAPISVPSFVPSPSLPSTNTLIQKHIYVHVPPPDEEEYRAPVPQYAPVSRQKHYKIIFIKAPSAPSVSQQLVQAQLAQQQQHEEKTLVYVLVKKPDSIEELQQNIPRVPLTQPSKPEVYFIKYKAQTGLSAPLPLSAPISGIQSSDLSLSGVTSGHHTTILSPATDSSSSSAAIAAAAAAAVSSGPVVESSHHSVSSSASDASLAATIAATIQPRKPAEEYGPPK